MPERKNTIFRCNSFSSLSIHFLLAFSSELSGFCRFVLFSRIPLFFFLSPTAFHILCFLCSTLIFLLFNSLTFSFLSYLRHWLFPYVSLPCCFLQLVYFHHDIFCHVPFYFSFLIFHIFLKITSFPVFFPIFIMSFLPNPFPIHSTVSTSSSSLQISFLFVSHHDYRRFCLPPVNIRGIWLL